MNRRRFFREGLRELLKPIAQTIEPIERAAHELGKLERIIGSPAAPASPTPTHIPKPDVYLRPPGALDEMAFRETCSRCGTCANVCPVNAIKIDTTGHMAHGAPYIDIDTQPCVACDGLYCMNNCPSGALVPIPLTRIDMGLATWHEQSCLRTHGQNCTACVDQCPIGTAALDIDGPCIRVKEAGCIGCGVCQFHCPTSPNKSINVIPKGHVPTPADPAPQDV